MKHRKGILLVALSTLILGGIVLITEQQPTQKIDQIASIDASLATQETSLHLKNSAITERTLLTISTSPIKHCQNDIALDEKALLSLPQHTFSTHHTWSKTAEVFSGPLLQDVINLACHNAGKLRLTALNNYSIEMDFMKLHSYRPIIAHSINGKRLSIRNKGPLWLMIPLDQYPELPALSMNEMLIWQLSDIKILSVYASS